MVRYDAVPKTASVGVAIMAGIGFTKKSSAAVNPIESPKNNTAVFPMAKEASFSFFAPTAFAIVTVAPIASPTIITVSICIT